MANPYATVSITGYNASPPPDDGSQTAANEITWAGIKTKLPDPLKAAIEAMNANVLEAFAKIALNGVTAIGTTQGLTIDDQGKLIAASNTITLTLPAASSVGTPFMLAVKNVGSGVVTIEGDGAETIDGVANLTLNPADAYILVCNGSAWTSLSAGNRSAGRGIAITGGIVSIDTTYLHDYKRGLTLSNNVSDANNDIDVSVGSATDATNAYFMKLGASITKRLDSNWAVGTNQGGLDTGSEANSTWYHVFLIVRSDTGVVDVLFSASYSSPTMPANYDYKRWIGAIYNNSSGNIEPFTQIGDTFRWTTPSLSLSNGTRGTTYAVITVQSPAGVVTEAFGSYYAPAQGVHFRPPFASDGTPSASASPLLNVAAGAASGGTWRCLTNSTASQIESASTGSASGHYLTTEGYRVFF